MATATIQQLYTDIKKATYRKQDKWLDKLTQYLCLRRYPQALLNDTL